MTKTTTSWATGKKRRREGSRASRRAYLHPRHLDYLFFYPPTESRWSKYGVAMKFLFLSSAVSEPKGASSSFYFVLQTSSGGLISHPLSAISSVAWCSD
jgi:hypothetical protein